jgi:hypothetical protein
LGFCARSSPAGSPGSPRHQRRPRWARGDPARRRLATLIGSHSASGSSGPDSPRRRVPWQRRPIEIPRQTRAPPGGEAHTGPREMCLRDRTTSVPGGLRRSETGAHLPGGREGVPQAGVQELRVLRCLCGLAEAPHRLHRGPLPFERQGDLGVDGRLRPGPAGRREPIRALPGNEPRDDERLAHPQGPTDDLGAFSVGRNASGQLLRGTVGALGFAWDQPRTQHWDVFGYPAAAPFDGERIQKCEASHAADDVAIVGAGPDPMAIGCDLGGGSSGGPWIMSFKRGTYINSVMSYGYNAQPLAGYGPYFDGLANVIRCLAATGGSSSSC